VVAEDLDPLVVVERADPALMQGDVTELVDQRERARGESLMFATAAGRGLSAIEKPRAWDDRHVDRLEDKCANLLDPVAGRFTGQMGPARGGVPTPS
jgi:hypothetical protein